MHVPDVPNWTNILFVWQEEGLISMYELVTAITWIVNELILK